MNAKFFKIISSTLCGMLLSTAILSANNGQNQCNCPCKLKQVRSVERTLGILRGTIAIESFTRTPSGSINSVTANRLLGKAFRVTAARVIDPANVAPLFSLAVGGNPANALSVRPFQIELDVAFDCPFLTEPTVVLSVESTATALGSQTAIIGSLISVVNAVTTTGFTASVYFITYGLSDEAVYNLLATVLNAQNNPRINFIATAKQ